MAKYLLTGHVLDQQETALVGKEVMLQRMYYPPTTTNGVVMGQELWFTTGAGGAVPAGFYLVPGMYRVECRVGAVRNVAYLDMPEQDAVFEEELVTVPETVIGRTALYLRYGDDVYKASVTGVTSAGVPMIDWTLDSAESANDALYLRFGSTVFKGSITGVTSQGVPEIDWEVYTGALT